MRKNILNIFISFFMEAILLFGSVSSNASMNMSYVELNNSQLSNVACFVDSKTRKPFFNMTSIFAANINGPDVNHPYVFFNKEVDQLLNHSNTVSELQKKGVKVLLTILGNHEQAGWSCMTDSGQAKAFANELALIADKYHLDGIDIDDEYSPCGTNDYSMIMISKFLKENPLFKGKLLTKALFQDYHYFQSSYDDTKLSDFLDYGWEMSYGAAGPDVRLPPYVDYGMKKTQLLFGESTGDYIDQAALWAVDTLYQGYRGVMVYNVTKHSQTFLDLIAKAEGFEGVDVEANCLK